MKSPKLLAKRRGQASVEYIVVATAVLISIAVVSLAGQRACVQNMAGDASASDCKDIGRAVAATLKKSVEEVTYLINLPF
jgi:hypothetical protein